MHVDRSSLHRISRFALSATLAAATTVALAQGPQNNRDDNNKGGRPGQGQGQNDKHPSPPQNGGKPGGPPQGGNRPGPPQGGNKPGPPQNGNRPGPQQNGNRPGPPQGGNRPGPPQGGNRPSPPPNNWHFQGGGSGHFSHYRNDANRWRNNPKRPRFYAGQAIPRNYVIQTVPSSYYAGYPPPPPGYRYGYYDGYVVAYNPVTRIVADVLDLLTGN